MMSLWPCHWGKLLQVTFHGCGTCQFAPLLQWDLHESDMSRKKRDAFRCTGAGFRESDTFVSVFQWGWRLEGRVFGVLDVAVPWG